VGAVRFVVDAMYTLAPDTVYFAVGTNVSEKPACTIFRVEKVIL
jgi:hypothetical protein